MNEPAKENSKDFIDWIREPKRARSPEIDYGCHWRRRGSHTQWRVSWIEQTGELYAVNLWSQEFAVLCVLTDRPAVEGAMEGWAALCVSDGSLDVLLARLQAMEG